MKPSTALVIKAALGLAAAATTAFAGSSLGARAAHNAHEDQFSKLIHKVDDLASDVRLLKCAAKFPGDCPGQAHR